MGILTKVISASPIENLKLLELAGESAEGVIYPRLKFDPTKPTEIYKKFAKVFKDKYGISPGIAAAYSYDAASLLLYSIELGGIKGEQIQKIMSKVRNYEGVTRFFSFDENGDAIRETELFIVKNRKFVPLKIN